MSYENIFKDYSKNSNLKPKSLSVIRSRWNKFVKWATANEIEPSEISEITLIKFQHDHSDTKGIGRYASSTADILNISIDQKNLIGLRSDPLSVNEDPSQVRERIITWFKLEPSNKYAICSLFAGVYGLKLNEIKNIKKSSFISENVLLIGNGLKRRKISLEKDHYLNLVEYFNIFNNIQGETPETTLWRYLKKELSSKGLNSSLQGLRNSYILWASEHTEVINISAKVGHLRSLSTLELIERLNTNEYNRKPT